MPRGAGRQKARSFHRNGRRNRGQRRQGWGSGGGKVLQLRPSCWFLCVSPRDFFFFFFHMQCSHGRAGDLPCLFPAFIHLQNDPNTLTLHATFFFLWIYVDDIKKSIGSVYIFT